MTCRRFRFAALLGAFLTPGMFADVFSDNCTEAKGPPEVHCPGAPGFGDNDFKPRLNEVDTGMNATSTPLLLVAGELVFCDGAGAKADHSGCTDGSTAVGDILQFVNNAQEGTDIKWLSDISANDPDHPDIGGNGADVANLKVGDGLAWYMSEAALGKSGYEKMIYTATNDTGESAIYELTSDNPEPSTLLLLLSGVAFLGIMLRRRTMSW